MIFFVLAKNQSVPRIVCCLEDLHGKKSVREEHCLLFEGRVGQFNPLADYVAYSQFEAKGKNLHLRRYLIAVDECVNAVALLLLKLRIRSADGNRF